jgi:hypothetical protein
MPSVEAVEKRPDTLLKIAPRFSYAVESLAHGLLLANSKPLSFNFLIFGKAQEQLD